MRLTNTTSFPATLVRAQTIYRDLLLGTVVAKLSYAIDERGDAQPLPADEQLPVLEGDTPTPLGVLEADVVPIKAGCDLALYGPALASPRGAAVKELTVGVQIGSSFDRRVRVVGDRVWGPAALGFRASPPIPFSEMALDWSRAYGGTAIHKGTLAAPYADNPDGRGFVVRREDVPGIILPNLEEIDQPITSWSDRPLPASLLPLPRHSALRGGRGIVVDLEEQTVAFTPEAFNFAHPRMRLPRFPEGERLDVFGMTHEGRWRARLPSIRLELELGLGDASWRLRLVPDTLVLLPAWNRFYVLARRAFVYQFVPEQERHATLHIRDADVHDDPRPSSIAHERSRVENGEAPAVSLLPVEPDPSKMPLPFEFLIANEPLRKVLGELPLCLAGQHPAPASTEPSRPSP